MKEALEAFDIDHFESEVFNKLVLAVEHHTELFKFYIEIKIHRIHKAGEFPFSISVNALNSEFVKASDSKDKTKESMEKIFENQKSYDSFLQSKEVAFTEFLNELEISVKKFMETDDIKRESSVKMVRPKEVISGKSDIGHNHYSEPAFYRYYGAND